MLDERRSTANTPSGNAVSQARRNPLSDRDLKTAAPDRRRSGCRPETNSRHPRNGAGTTSAFAAEQVSAELSSGTGSSPSSRSACGHAMCTHSERKAWPRAPSDGGRDRPPQLPGSGLSARRLGRCRGRGRSCGRERLMVSSELLRTRLLPARAPPPPRPSYESARSSCSLPGAPQAHTPRRTDD